MNQRPIIGISMGDPFGNGPEITVRALSHAAIYEQCRPLVVGDATAMRYALRVAKKRVGTAPELNLISTPTEAAFQFGKIDLIDLALLQPAQIPDTAGLAEPQPFGVGACALGGECAFEAVRRVIELAMSGAIDGTVTNALSKEAINMAGHHFSGHTEIYAHYTNAHHYAMMLAHHDLRVVHVSTHVSMREACDRVKTSRVLECIRMADKACRQLGIAVPKIGVLGLNPHCGENGLFGTEEIKEIQPAIDIALSDGICIPDRKPIPSDTAFSKALGGWYDILVTMYHDQGHIPIKVEGFVYDRTIGSWKSVEGVNITLGLPIVRVSVDHGTGFGHAGDGGANEMSLLNAIDYASRFSRKAAD